MPFYLLVGVQRLGQPKIDVGRHTRDARAGRMGVGGYDQVRKLVEQRELGPREKFGGALKDGCCGRRDRKSTRLNSSHSSISYAVFCLKKKINTRVSRS